MWKYKKFFTLHIAIIVNVMMVNKAIAAQEILGRFPLCEASSALLVTCPDRNSDCLLVGDNEQGKELYLFPIKDKKLNSEAQFSFDLHLPEGEAISDIEALTSTSSDEILAFASHSRNTSCEIKKKRQKFGKLSLSKTTTEIVDTLRAKKITCDNLFDKQVLDASMKAVCEAIDTADLKATQIDDDVKTEKLTQGAAKVSCNAVNAYNAEGAVATLSTKGTEVWIGLRAPLVPSHPSHPEKKQLAILLHLKDLTAYTFDRVALVDLGRRGIRDMSSDEKFIWVIAGPSEDRTEPFELRRIPKTALDKSNIINSELISILPSSSEGLAISGKTAYIVIDGDRGKEEQQNQKVCKEPARYEIITLP